ncbi:hypothetical protein [Sodalis sp. RH16]|uniref:hypothetical protein n=1 Tax=unclassified Sodalis (in: enterobacteria) TaxID=2636512 RepID=UPI0039B4D304
MATIRQFVKPKAHVTDLVWNGNAHIGANLQKSSTRSQNYALDFNGKLSHACGAMISAAPVIAKRRIL